MARAKKPATPTENSPAKSPARQLGGLGKDDENPLLLQIQRILAVKRHVRHQRMFGGIAFFLHGNLVVGLWKGGLIARIGPQQAASALLQPQVSEFQPTTSGRAMKGWVVIEGGALAGPNQLEQWVALSVEFVETLPIKPDNEEPLEEWVERSLRFA